jgi:hypothetical protein
MLVRDKMNAEEAKKRAKAQNKEDVSKGKRVNKKKEEGAEVDEVQV